MRFSILAVLSLAASAAMANGTILNALSPYTAVCVDEKAERYYLGEEGRWRSERMAPDGKIELEKLDYQGALKASSAIDMAACTAERVTTIAPHIHFVEGCYAVKEINEQGRMAERREMCSEYYYEGKIVSVDCRVLSFQPNGTFQRQRWVADSTSNAQEAVLKTSGNCRVVKP